MNDIHCIRIISLVILSAWKTGVIQHFADQSSEGSIQAGIVGIKHQILVHTDDTAEVIEDAW